MQRKNYSLNKKGIAMIMAIAVIIIIATILTLSISLTSQTTKRNIDMYLSEQSEMLADSAREYALYSIDNNATHCGIGNLNFTQDTLYNINIDMKYITRNGCTDGIANNNEINDSALIHESVILDITIFVDANLSGTTENIKYFKRYIENIKS